MKDQADKPTVDKVEEVSLIMALGKMVHIVNTYGPPADNSVNELFVEKMSTLVFGMEDSFRETSDFVTLKDDLWYARCFATDFDKFARALPIDYEGCGLLKGHGSDKDGDYEYVYSPYASDITWHGGWSYRLTEWSDIHKGFAPVSTSKDFVDILAAL